MCYSFLPGYVKIQLHKKVFSIKRENLSIELAASYHKKDCISLASDFIQDTGV